tara:strand:+ start:238 stop:459 length:222 start_codon:yes stop_codon:yes gene_type:complete
MKNKNTNKKENTMKKKIYEYMTLVFATLGTFAMVSAVGAIETDQYLLAGSAVCIGFASFIMSLFSQQLYSEAK